MNAVIFPGTLSGTVRAVASKSQAHRSLICAALSDGPTTVYFEECSEDLTATIRALEALGAAITKVPSGFFVTPISALPETAMLDCGESGSTLRFLLPICCALGIHCTLRLHGLLPKRPLSPLWEELERHGAVLSRPTPDTISVSGRLWGRDFSMDGSVSSQFLTGLLLALPRLGGGTLTLTGALQSAAYVEMTLQALSEFSVSCRRDGNRFSVEGAYRSPEAVTVEGDWSNAAFFLCANAICGGISCENLNPDSLQGDRAVLSAISRIQAGNAVIDGSEIPDLLPVLAVFAASVPTVTTFCHAERLRLKESDRIASTVSLLRSLGGQAEETRDGFTVTGTGVLRGGTADGCGDHRIVMSAAVASLLCREPVTILGAEAVKKSYPTFFDEFRRLGGTVRLEEP